jgi:iron complex outermembrane receptor protein
MYSGVFWDAKDVLLEDVDRIEVVRGPGATLWGANAVNGVINVITRDAAETQGTYTSLGMGNEERGQGAFRYGGQMGDELSYRVYAKYFDRDRSVLSTGEEAADSWDTIRGGFRLDWKDQHRSSFMFQGDVYDGTAGQTQAVPALTPPYMQIHDDSIGLSGGHVLGRWNRALSDASSLSLQLYYDRAKRDDPLLAIVGSTVDAELQHRASVGRRHDIVWGLGYRRIRYDLGDTFAVTFPEDLKAIHLANAFLQDDIMLVPNRFRLTLGSKFEHHEHSGQEVLPNIRFVWTPADRHAVWGAASRAARTPSMGELGARFVVESAAPGKYHPDRATLVTLNGRRDFESEYLIAYEMGYRVQPTNRVSVDIALFYNDYDNLRSTPMPEPALELSPLPPHFLIPFGVGNAAYAETRGAELAGDWQASDWWRLHASYSWFEMVLHLGENSEKTFTETMHGDSPEHAVFVRSSMDLPRGLNLDVGFRWIDELEAYGIDSYSTVDVALGWSVGRSVSLSLVGQNLLDQRHAEFVPELYYTTPTEVERGVYLKASWRP